MTEMENRLVVAGGGGGWKEPGHTGGTRRGSQVPREVLRGGHSGESREAATPAGVRGGRAGL